MSKKTKLTNLTLSTKELTYLLELLEEVENTHVDSDIAGQAGELLVELKLQTVWSI
jgi:hypothetical protein